MLGRIARALCFAHFPTCAALRNAPAAQLCSMTSQKGKKYYAVHHGRNGFRGVLSDWNACQNVVNRVPGAVYKSFKTRAEAVEFAEHGRGGPHSHDVRGQSSRSRPRPHRPVELPVVVPDPALNWPTSPSEDDGEDPRANVRVTVHTDGACSNNGKRGARAGVGVFFGDGSDLNVSEPLAGEAQTNQRAEMTGVLRAFTGALSHGLVGSGDTLVVKTDSKYTTTGLSSWLAKWAKNGFKTSAGQPVKNIDLWMDLREAREALWDAGVVVEVQWVKGHDGEYGNEQADRLAVAGAAQHVWY